MRVFVVPRAIGGYVSAAAVARALGGAKVLKVEVQSDGDPAKASTWLRTEKRALRGETPLGLLATDIGARMVERILGRIEHGVYS
jgi:putative toxin-antitoxin system antitoxin component (TIGR02293 family)